MAYLSPATLTCPTCQHSCPLTWITGKPLNKNAQGSTGYVRVHKSGDWTVQNNRTEIIIFCPVCKTETARRSRTP